MKKEIFYLIGAVAGALLVLLAVPLGNAYIGNYLSVYGGMDTQSYVLLMQSAVTGFQILGGVLSNDFILECPGVQLYAGAFLIVLFGEFPSMCSVENFLPPLDKWIRQLYYSIVI